MITTLFCIFFLISQEGGGKTPSFFKETQRLINAPESEYKEREDELLKALLSAGMFRNYPTSYALVSQSVRALLTGNFSRGERLYITASMVSPDLPAVHYIYGKGLREIGISGTFQSFIQFFKFILLKYSNPFSSEEMRVIWLYNLFIFILLVLSITSLAFLIKNFPSLFHFFKEVFGFLLPEWGIKVFIFLILSIPVILKIPIGYLIPSYLTFFVIFSRKGERGTKVIAFLLLILFGSLDFIGKEISSHFDPQRLQHLAYMYNYHSGQWKRELFSMDFKENDEELFVKGLLFLKTGEYEKAKLIFETLLKKGFYKEKCINNLGIVEYALGNPKDGEKYFTEGAKTSLFLPEAHYNLSIIYFSQAKLEEGKEELGIAKKMLPQTVERISRFSSKENVNLLFLPSELQPSEFMGGFKSELDITAYKRIMKPFFGKSPQNKSIIISIICGLVILIFQIPLFRLYLPNICRRCEKVYCSLCDESPLENECGFCYTVYILKEKISPEERIKSEIETSRRYYRKRWIVITSNILLPGMGYIIGDKSIRGLFLLFFWILLFEPLFLSGHMTRGLMPFSVGISFLEIASIVLIAFIVWILTVFRMRNWR